jgi:drug/metabolite transporter (DMT)-like permease
MAWFYLSLLSVFALAAAELIQQRLMNLKNALNERTSAVLTFLFQSILALIIILLSPLRDQIFSIFYQEIIFKVLAVAIIASFSMIFYLKSFKVKNISISTIFISCSAIVSSVLGVIFLNESWHALKFLGIFLVLFAIFILNFKNFNLEKNHYYGLLAGLLFGISYTIDKSIVISINPLVYLFWAFFLVSAFGFILNPQNVINSIKGKAFNSFKLVFISGTGYFLYNFFTFTAYKMGGEVGRIDAINNSQIFLIIIFEFFILRNKQSIKRKLITAMIAVAGILILGFVK